MSISTEQYMVCRFNDKSKYRLVKEEYDPDTDHYMYHCLDLKSYNVKISDSGPLHGYPIMDIIKGQQQLRTMSFEDMSYMDPEWYITITNMKDRLLYYLKLPNIEDDRNWKKRVIPVFNDFRKHCTSVRVENYINKTVYDEDSTYHSIKRLLWRYWFLSKEMGYHNIDIKYQYRQKKDGYVSIYVDGNEI